MSIILKQKQSNQNQKLVFKSLTHCLYIYYQCNMDKIKNKKTSNKTSFKNIKNQKKPLQVKDSLITSARTPRSGGFNVDFKKYPLEKFKSIKSIPTITYRDIETTVFPSQLHENRQNYSYLNHTECKLDSDIESMKAINLKRLLSDRRVERSVSRGRKKESILLKTKNQQKVKRKKQSLKRDRTKQRRNTTLNIINFETSAADYQTKPQLKLLVKRTSELLIKYKNRQEQWRKQKQDLMKELQKYKRKVNGKSITTTTSSHNSQSYKLLI